MSLVIIQRSYSKTDNTIRQNCDLFMIKKNTQQMRVEPLIYWRFTNHLIEKGTFSIDRYDNSDSQLKVRMNYGGNVMVANNLKGAKCTTFCGAVGSFIDDSRSLDVCSFRL